MTAHNGGCLCGTVRLAAGKLSGGHMRLSEAETVAMVTGGGA